MICTSKQIYPKLMCLSQFKLCYEVAVKKTRTIAFCNMKGGVGKSSGVVYLAGALAAAGKKVLVLDLDPQSHATGFLGLKATEGRTISEVLRGELLVKDVIVERSKNLWILPASRALDDTQQLLIATPGKEMILRDEMADVTGFDFILVDTPPSLNLLLYNVLVYVKEVVLTIQTEAAALEGVPAFYSLIKKIKVPRLNQDIDVTGVLCTMCDSRTNLHRDVVDEIRGALKSKVFDTVIPRSVVFAEAASHGKLISEYAPKSSQAAIYDSLAKEVQKGGQR